MNTNEQPDNAQDRAPGPASPWVQKGASTSAASGEEPRKVGWALALGIALLPGLFVWLLLRKGHSGTVRVMGFSWAVLVLLAFVSVTSKLPVAPSSKASAGETQQQQATVPATSDGTAERQPNQIAGRRDLSASARRLALLYGELKQFRSDPQFLRVGYGRCCRFYQWKLEVEELDRTSGSQLLQELQVTPRELIQLGFEYMHNEGRVTELAESISSRFELALTPALPRAAGGGRATREGWWCRNIETWFASMQAMEQGDYGRSQDMRVEPACPHVLANTVTGPELERRHYTVADGQGRLEYVRVKLDKGPEVWAPLDSIEFR